MLQLYIYVKLQGDQEWKTIDILDDIASVHVAADLGDLAESF